MNLSVRPDSHGKGYQDDWYFVDIPRDGIERSYDPETEIEFINSSRRELILEWCVENCEKRWCEKGVLHYVFESQEDSVMFALRWG